MKKQKKKIWGPYFRLMKESKVPMWGCLVYLFAQTGITAIATRLPKVAGQLMAGQINEPGVVSTYVWTTLVTSVLGIAVSLLNSWLFAIFNRNLQRTVMRKITMLPLKDYQAIEPPTLISRVTADTAQIAYALFYFLTVLTVGYSYLAMIEIMWGINRQITLTLGILLPWMLIICKLTGGLIHKANHLRQAAFSRLTGYVSGRLLNIKLIKAFATQEAEDAAIDAYVKDLLRTDDRNALVDMLFTPLNSSLSMVGKGVVLIMGASLMAKDELMLGGLVGLIMYADQIPQILSQFMNCFSALKQSQGMSARAAEIVSMPVERLQRSASVEDVPPGDITFENVSFRYGQKGVLQDVSFTIPRGKLTAFVGPSGTGKTTLLNLVERLYQPTEGQIRYGETPVEDIHLDDWRASIGYIQQNSPLTAGTIRENIAFGLDREATQQELEDAAKAANAYDFIQKLPQGFDTAIGELGDKLSGGEKQRIAIARAILKNPPVLIMDEATSSLDAKNAGEVKKALTQAAEGRTVIMVTHDIQAVRNADQIVVLCDGSVQAQGTHQALYGTCQLYTDYCDLENARYTAAQPV